MRVTLITGASSGIGEEFARQLAVAGHNLVLVARREKPLHELCDELMLKHKVMAHYVALDLTGSTAISTLQSEIERHAFTVDWLINNAGFGSVGDFSNLEVERELEMIKLNISALVAVTHTFLRGMRERGHGVIINVSSAAAFQPIPFMATYSASKAFVSAFSEAIGEENRPHGVQVLTLCPGSTKTNFFAASNIDRPIKVKGQQTPADVVAAALLAVKSGRRKVVSGLANKAGAMMGKFTPNFISRRVLGAMLRPRFEAKE